MVTPGSYNPGLYDLLVCVDPPLASSLATGPGGSTPGPINLEIHGPVVLAMRGFTVAGSTGTARPASCNSCVGKWHCEVAVEDKLVSF